MEPRPVVYTEVWSLVSWPSAKERRTDLCINDRTGSHAAVGFYLPLALTATHHSGHSFGFAGKAKSLSLKSTTAPLSGTSTCAVHRIALTIMRRKGAF